MVASPQRIASAYLVLFGNYGDVTRHARARGVCRQRLRGAVVLGAEREAQFACVAQALGVSRPACWQLLDVLLAGRQQSVARAAGVRAGALLAALDDRARGRVREVAADEIYVK